ncbi:caspase family protein [Niveispirillum sp.]|uniref:caspase family protein n=1 Tax=Niveispirillum sp. TaxID=1917217 RepID=UPI001B6C61EE|nr:caspase family protein [Niveispirillum sp.]MBP7335885.1 caspase family protein [Niveispirillum sp.]
MPIRHVGFLLLVLLFGAIPAALGNIRQESEAGRKVALVIGNGAYKGAPVLQNPLNDAAAMRRALGGMGFSVIGGDDLDVAAMDGLLDRFAGMAAGAEQAVIYFSGHGLQVDGVNYLLPVDISLSTKRDLHRRAILADAMVEAMAGATGLRLLILDACRDNPFARALEATSGTKSVAVGKGLGQIAGLDGVGNTLVAYATRAGDVALDGTGNLSPYVKALTTHLVTPGLELNLLFGRVRDDVVRATGGRQIPFTYGSTGGQAIYLAGLPLPVEAPVLDRPTVADDKWTVQPGGQHRLSVLDNDKAAAGGALRIVAVTQPKAGEVRVAPDGRSLLAEVPANIEGELRFTYRVEDQGGGRAEGQVVLALSKPPVQVDVLSKPPVQMDENTLSVPLGLIVADLTERRRREFNIKPSVKGVVVIRNLKNPGSSGVWGLRPGNVIERLDGRPVDGKHEFNEMLLQSIIDRKNGVSLSVNIDGYLMFDYFWFR